jgi:hypothetical protein
MVLQQVQWLTAAVLVVAALALFAGPRSATAQSCYAPTALNFTSSQGALWLNGKAFKLKGTSWYSSSLHQLTFFF